MSPNLRCLTSPAMITALIALVVALGGVSYAAAVLPANSVGSKQIKKNAVTGRKVKNGTLTAADFKTGQSPGNTQGPKGDTGPKGESGAQGRDGVQGPAGRSALTPLKAGESESGVFALGGPSSGAQDFQITAVTFPIPLSHSIDAGHAIAVDGVASAAHCPGQGQADPDFLCLYVNGRSTEMNPLMSMDIRDPAQSPNSGADKRGFTVTGDTNAGASFAGIVGTWTYTEG
jgi:hypothetical protein